MRVLSVLLWALSASVISLQAVDAQEPGPIVFSEIMWMGSGASSADEWIELYNRGDRAIDLSGWTITRAASDGSEQAMVTIEEGSVEPGQTFLIANYAADSDRSHLATPVHYVSAAVALPNTKLLLRLYDAPEGGTIVDVADDGTGRPFGGTTEPPSSMVREVFEMPGTRADAWPTATESMGWQSGTAELGTPGTLPSRQRTSAGDRATGVSAMSWSQIKMESRD